MAFSCELLSFLYLWTIKSISKYWSRFLILVVNCFHFCIFELSKASNHRWDKTAIQLWIAFIFVSLNYQKHPNKSNRILEISCELLSFLYLWTIKSITSLSFFARAIVVNCFHFCIFELSKASLTPLKRILLSLWIAFIFVSLNYQKHPNKSNRILKVGCELLSFLYLWTIKSILIRVIEFLR